MPTLRPEPTVGRPAFLAWSLGGALLSFAFVSISSVGLFVLPLALVLFSLLTRYSPDSRDRWGFLAGAGGVLVLIGTLNADHRFGRIFIVVGVATIAASVFIYRRRLDDADGR